MNYYYSTDGSEVAGPYSDVELKQFLDIGALPPTTLICPEGEDEWNPISVVFAPISRKQTSIRNPISSAANAEIKHKQPERAKLKSAQLLTITLSTTALIIITITSVLLWRHGVFAPNSTTPENVEIKQLTQEVAQLKAAQPSIPSPSPTPIVKAPLLSEVSKANIIIFIEKASKLRAMAEQGVSLDDFKSQLSEVKGTWDSITTVGLPDQLHTEVGLFGTAISAWSLAQEIWSDETEAKAESLETPGTSVLFALRAGPTYRSKLDEISNSLRTYSVLPITSPAFANSGAYEMEITRLFKDLTKDTVGKIEEAQNGSEIDFADHQFLDVMTAFDQAAPDGFTESFSFSSLKTIPDLVSQISAHRKEICDGGLDPVSAAEAGVKVAELNETITKTFIAIFQRGAENTPSRIDPTKIVRPDAAIQWCFAAAASALDAAKDGISKHLKNEQETQ